MKSADTKSTPCLSSDIGFLGSKNYTQQWAVNMFEKALKIEKRSTTGLFPIKKVDKGAIVPINVISLKLFQHQHRPDKCS